jgi:NAD(P) transhydrogenase subunit beta
MIVDALYLLAAIFFIFGIKGLTRVRTSRRGNFFAAIGMFIAILATLLKMQLGDEAVGIEAGAIGWEYIILGVIIGGGIGAILSKITKMTAMPQLVAFFNGMGGGASTLVALAYFWERSDIALDAFDITTVILSVVIGTITLTGSLIAYGKLQGIVKSQPILFPGRNALNMALFIGIVLIGLRIGMIQADFGAATMFFIILVIVSAVLGVFLVTPIGGADMPVVIALFNSYSGLAAAATGFVLKNELLIISGALVGASGLILTNIMCKAMNRSIWNVLFGGFGAVETKSDASKEYTNIKEVSAEELALMFDSAESLIVVPGYGMAVAQAQHSVHELEEFLEKKGVKVSYAIHPVAGRMPGHMNVLLAEANVPYEKLYDLVINSEFQSTDIVLIIGANDVVNPAATNDPKSPIAGMPVLKVWEAKTVIMVKRSLSPGFAGIKNELFDYDNTLMLFGDAKKVVTEVVQELKELD